MCKFCGFNHRINKCDKANKFLGERLTKSNWRMIDVVPELNEPACKLLARKAVVRQRCTKQMLFCLVSSQRRLHLVGSREVQLMTGQGWETAVHTMF